MFTITRQGFDYYTELFGTPYPFAKYDQVFVPEFSAGAMENVACVVISEQLLDEGLSILEDAFATL